MSNAPKLKLPLSIEFDGDERTRHPYVVVDAFTQTPLAGNQLAVFTDGRGFDTAKMQSVGRELNLAETVFVLPPDGDGDLRIRIFTPRIELPFAGHPVLGTAFVAASALARDAVTLETQSGPVTVEFDRSDRGLEVGRFTRSTPPWEPFESAAELLSALGVERSLLPIDGYLKARATSTSRSRTRLRLRRSFATSARWPSCRSASTASRERPKLDHEDVRRGLRHTRRRRDRIGRRPARGPSRSPWPDRLRGADRDPPGRIDRPPVNSVCPGARHRGLDHDRRGRGIGRDRRRRRLPHQIAMRPENCSPTCSPPASTPNRQDSARPSSGLWHGLDDRGPMVGADGRIERGRADVNRVAASGAGLSAQREPSAERR